MKQSEIKVGEEYAQSNESGQSRYSWGRFNASRVRVLEHTTKQVGRSWEKKTQPAVKIVYLDSKGKPKTVTREGVTSEIIGVVANREIKEPWTGYAKRKREHEAAERKGEQVRAEAEAKQSGVNREIFKALQAKVPMLNKQGYSAPYISEFALQDFLVGQKTKLELDQETLAAILGVEIPEEVEQA